MAVEAETEMRRMLRDVYNYNFGFSKKERIDEILEAMYVIDRKYFVDKNPYEDAPQLIGNGQTISQPSTVARMLLLAELEKGDDVLEVGAGSGWNACLVAYLVYPGKVLSIDRVPELIERAKENYSKLEDKIRKKMNLKFEERNFFNMKGRFDKIIITAGIHETQEEKIKKRAEELLGEEGIMICPRTFGPIIIGRKKKKKLTFENTRESYVFVPLIE